MRLSVFFFNDTATTEIYTLSLHDALPIWQFLLEQTVERRLRGLIERSGCLVEEQILRRMQQRARQPKPLLLAKRRSEEHTSELQSHLNLVCRLLLEKKKRPQRQHHV